MGDFTTYLKAGYSLLWVQTAEEERAIGELGKAAIASGYQAMRWDIVGGLRNIDGSKQQVVDNPIDGLNAIGSVKPDTVIFMADFHKFFEDIVVIRTCKSLVKEMTASGKHFVFVSHGLAIPAELTQDVTVIDFELPTLEQLMATAGRLVVDNELAIEVSEQVIAVAKGLTAQEAENAFSRCLVERKEFDRRLLEDEKLQVVRKSGLAEIWPAGSMADVGGLARLKRYIESRKAGFEAGSTLPVPKGILLCGLPGSGKSLSAKAVAGALEMPLIRLDLGTLKGGLVGESEANMRKATQLIDAISPCVVWLDEIEKALSGVQSSGKTDGGTGSNMFGQLLTWMQESKAMHYIVATCNDMDDLLSISQGALIRRFDSIFFVDLPGAEERAEIFGIMCKRYGVTDAATLAIGADSFTGWTGAEIETFVKNSLYDGVVEALANVKPIALQNKGKIDRAREWAKGNAIMANGAGLEVVSGRAININ